MSKDDLINCNVRLPIWLRKVLKNKAEEGQRSLSAQIRKDLIDTHKGEK